MPSPRQALTAFADTAQNPDLARLESLLKRFNLFEAVGVVRHELRHYDFLAFLLDPSRSHGLACRLSAIQILRSDDYDKTGYEIEAIILKMDCVFARRIASYGSGNSRRRMALETSVNYARASIMVQ